MESPRHTARGIVIKDSKLLLMERWRGRLHYFSIPGGGIEPGETPQRTVVREIAEETTCVVRVERSLYVLNTEGGNQHQIFLCRYESGEPHLPEGSPEYLQNNPDNRFAPRWLEISDLDAVSFITWQPVADRLIQDLRTGFAPDVVTLPGRMVG